MTDLNYLDGPALVRIAKNMAHRLALMRRPYKSPAQRQLYDTLSREVTEIASIAAADLPLARERVYRLCIGMSGLMSHWKPGTPMMEPLG